MHHLSICAGIAGIDLGLKQCIRDLRTVAMVEREAWCCAHLVRKMEEGKLDPAPIYPDLHRFPFHRYRGLVDIVSGGFPCQPFSTAGQRRGTEDERHLWPIIRDGVKELQPLVCFWENVDGIASAKSPGYHSVLHHVLSDMEEMGYKAEAGCFSAEEVGAPHLRKRWFILGVGNAKHNGSPATTQQGSVDEASGNDKKGQKSARESKGAGRSRSSEYLRSSQTLANTHSSRGQVSSAEGSTQQPVREMSRCSGQKWPARPGQQQHEWEQSRTTESRLGGPTHGIPHRLDRLRALGNAVVPQTAAVAFSTLWYRLMDQ